MIFQDRWYQTEAVDAIFAYFMNGNTGNPLVAAPTGTGKSVIIARLLQRIYAMWPNQRVILLTHVKELIAQNAEKLAKLWPLAPLGIYSAGLGEKDTVLPIIFGGIASVHGNVGLFGHRDLLLIDEAHLVSPDGNTMYQQVIEDLKKINPYLKIIGFTATDYRMGHGKLTDEGGIFTDVCYDITGVDAFNRLIAEGYLAPLIPRRTQLELDVSGVGMVNGDYAQGALQRAVDKQEITYAALQEACSYGQDRRSWLVFASGIEHAEHCAAMLESFGIPTTFVHSKVKEKERDRRIAALKRGEYRAMVGNNVFTTGFDHPPLDMIIDLQPTMSVVKHVQKYGRGTRISPETGKQNCLVLDFARNTRRLGPINDPIKPRRKGEGGGTAPVRICEDCGTYNHASARVCCYCGVAFKFEVKIVKNSGTDELIRSDIPVVEYYDVHKMICTKHNKFNGKAILKVSYYCGMFKFDEYVCLEHTGYASKQARDWWRQRHATEPPATVDEALQYIKDLRVPRRVKVWVNKQHPEILSYEW